MVGNSMLIVRASIISSFWKHEDYFFAICSLEAMLKIVR